MDFHSTVATDQLAVVVAGIAVDFVDKDTAAPLSVDIVLGTAHGNCLRLPGSSHCTVHTYSVLADGSPLDHKIGIWDSCHPFDDLRQGHVRTLMARTRTWSLVSPLL